MAWHVAAALRRQDLSALTEPSLTRATWWGGRRHRGATVVVLVVLASLDNTALALLPALFGTVSEQLRVSEAAVALVTAVTLLLTAVSAAVWGYVGDRANRKLLLVFGTLVWSAGLAVVGVTNSYTLLFVGHVLASLGLGAVASIGFAVISDLVAPRHRGLAMSFWGVSQGVGTVLGTLTGGFLGAGQWQQPFVIISVAGLVVALLYLAGYDTPRGASEPALRELHEQGEAYPYRIQPQDLHSLARRRTNIWLVAQGLTAQFAYGSLIWLPRLFQAKVEAQGYDDELSTAVGSLFAALFQVGAVFSVVGGWLGDRWQQRDPRGRALLSAIGILGAIPFFLAMFLLPLRVELPAGASTFEVIVATVGSIFTEPTVAATFACALLALALTSADSPNWFALIGDVNLPEHRGTVFGVGNLVNGVGRAAGNGLVGAVFGSGALAALTPPLNFAVGLASFQLFFIPTGWCYWKAAEHAPEDIGETHRILRSRARRGDPSG